MAEKIILSGAKPSGNLTLGNYIGAIQPWVESLNQSDKLYFFIADMHAITVPQDSKELYERSLLNAAIYIACGLDPKKCTMFIQSQIKEHAELGWILTCRTPMGWLERMTQYKDAAQKNKERVFAGLFTYPTLMASDILLYDATHIPVGDDQKQHVELARDICQKFNHDYKKEILVMPTPVIRKEGTRIMSLSDATEKMGKSSKDLNANIYIMDEDEAIISKIKKAKTDSGLISKNIKELENRPELKNLITIYSVLSNLSIQEVLNKYDGAGFGKFKPELADLIISKLSPIREHAKKLLQNKDELEKILKKGADEARSVATKKLDIIKKTIGFVV